MRSLSERFNGLFDADTDDLGELVSAEADALAYWPELREILNDWFVINYPDTLKTLQSSGIECPYRIEPEKNNVLIRVRDDIGDIVMFSDEYAREALNLNSELLTKFCKKHNQGLIISGEISDIYITGDNDFGPIELNGARVLLRPLGPELSNIHFESRKSVRCLNSEIGIETKSLSKLDSFEGGKMIVQGDEIILNRDQLRTRTLVLCSANRYFAPKCDIQNLRLPSLRHKNSEFRTDVSINLLDRLKKQIKGTGLLMNTKTLSETLDLPADILEFYISNRLENNTLESRASRKVARLGIQQIGPDKFRIAETK